MDFLPFLHAELDALADEILSLSGRSRTRLDEAAIELSVGIDLCCGGPDADPDGALDPYDEFKAFARDPGLDYENVEGSEIAELSRRQKSMAVAWHYVHFARIILDGHDLHRDCDDACDEDAYAQKLKHAARKLIEDSVEHDTGRSAVRRP